MKTMSGILFLSPSILLSLSFFPLVPSLSPFSAIINSANANRVALKLACRVCHHGCRAKHTALTKPLIYSRGGFSAAGLWCAHIHTRSYSRTHTLLSQTVKQTIERHTETGQVTEFNDAAYEFDLTRDRVREIEGKHLHFDTHTCTHVCTQHVPKLE